MSTMDSLLSQYESVYSSTKMALEVELETARKKERIWNRIAVSIISIFLISMGIDIVFGENIPAFSPIGALLTMGMLPLPLTVVMARLGITGYLNFDLSGEKWTAKKEELETKLKQLIEPSDIGSAFDGLRNTPPEKLVSVSLIPAHYFVKRTVFAGIEPVMIGGKMMKGYKGAIVELEADDLPPILRSIRGKNGPETKSELIYKYILWDGPETVGQTRETKYFCISKEQFEDIPDKIHTNAVRVTLFPELLGDAAWQFLVLQPDAYDELKAAMETLCVTVVQSVAETNAKTMLTRAIEEGSALYRPDDERLVTQDDIIACFSRKEDNGETDGPLSDAFEAVEAVLPHSMLGFNFAAPAIEAKAPEIVVDSVTA